MSLLLNLPPELETELAAEAARLNLSLPDYVVQILGAGLTSPIRPRTGAELVAYWQREGLVGTRTDITYAPSHARALREQAQRRRRRD